MNEMPKHLKEQLQSNSFAEKNQSKERCFENDTMAYSGQYQNTPLWIRGTETDGYYVTMGNKRISEPYPTIGEAEDAIKRLDWNILLNAMIGIFTNLQELNNANINQTQTETMENDIAPLL